MKECEGGLCVYALIWIYGFREREHEMAIKRFHIQKKLSEN